MPSYDDGKTTSTGELDVLAYTLSVESIGASGTLTLSGPLELTAEMSPVIENTVVLAIRMLKGDVCELHIIRM